MRGRLFFYLAVFALIGFLASMVWAAAIVVASAPRDPLWQVGPTAMFLLPTGVALWPRSRDEQLLAGAPTGLHRSNRRAALGSCFAPYRPRRGWLGFGKTGSPRLNLITALLIAAVLWTRFIVPLFAFTAFVLTLRRAAWLGIADAILLEWDWLRVSGPVLTDEGRSLAACCRRR